MGGAFCIRNACIYLDKHCSVVYNFMQNRESKEANPSSPFSYNYIYLHFYEFYIIGWECSSKYFWTGNMYKIDKYT